MIDPAYSLYGEDWESWAKKVEEHLTVGQLEWKVQEHTSSLEVELLDKPNCKVIKQ